MASINTIAGYERWEERKRKREAEDRQRDLDYAKGLFMKIIDNRPSDDSLLVHPESIELIVDPEDLMGHGYEAKWITKEVYSEYHEFIALENYKRALRDIAVNVTFVSHYSNYKKVQDNKLKMELFDSKIFELFGYDNVSKSIHQVIEGASYMPVKDAVCNMNLPKILLELGDNVRVMLTKLIGETLPTMVTLTYELSIEHMDRYYKVTYSESN